MPPQLWIEVHVASPAVLQPPDRVLTFWQCDDDDDEEVPPQPWVEVEVHVLAPPERHTCRVVFTTRLVWEQWVASIINIYIHLPL